MAINFKLETGIQLLTRLLKKPGIENFYPMLFEKGPKQGDIIELFSNAGNSCLLLDIICELLLPVELGGVEGSILIFNTDGNLDFMIIVESLKKKLLTSIKKGVCESKIDYYVDNALQVALKKMFFVEIFDATQFSITIQNLESVLSKHSSISLVIFDTLTAFYWSEQSYKITKMDLYIKNLLRIIQKVTKDYKVTVLYTRPEYFSSTKEVIENLEPCFEFQTLEQLNYRIHMMYAGDATYEVVVRTHEKQIKRHFIVCDGFITWL
ncbi:unnamed protein product [Parnassius mnemosyne]|uniref:DNA recombination and repair protein Rad51-like C-terminal domain-containing protein n=1 Tax=Parnassius mnemosyne TaxID=213953 RepID=A0AAV1LWX4_9NEOP